MRITSKAPATQCVLLFIGCVLAGMGLRASESAAHALMLDSECVAEVWGELVEVRRVSGDGLIEAQAWPEQVLLDLVAGTLGFFDDRPAEPGYEEFELEPEAAP